MIGKLKGIIEEIYQDHLLIDVNGVGYLVFVSAKTISSLPPKNNLTSLLIHTHVREDNISLYGFGSEQEKEWFLRLVSVNGIGNKLALAILSNLAPEQVVTAIFSKDIALLSSVPGVGKKIAERLVTELKDKSTSYQDQKNIYQNNKNTDHAHTNNMLDAVSALANLGYSKSDAYEVCNRIVKQYGENITLSEFIRLSLKELAK